MAFDIYEPWRLIGKPNWAASAWYQLNAKSASPVDQAEKYRMLLPVLEERFKLKWHRETRQIPVYYLSVANGGIKLKTTAPGTCRAIDLKDAGPPDPKKPPVCGRLLDGRPKGEINLEGAGVTVARLADELGHIMGRPVIDSTKTPGLFDFHLRFTPVDLAGSASPPSETAADPSGLPSVFTALKQAGLAVKTGQGPMEVTVIDSIERPSAN